MKTSYILLLLSLTTLLSAVTINPILVAAADATPSPVLDIEGKNLQTGVKYYILPVFRGRGGGLTLASHAGSTAASCPLDVVQEQQEVNGGLPLTFSPITSTKGVVRVSTDMNIKFSAATTCVQFTVWRLGDNNESLGKYFVMTGGADGNPGHETISNWFKIEKYNNDYKLVFCPAVCNFCKVVCSNGFFTNGVENRWCRVCIGSAASRY